MKASVLLENFSELEAGTLSDDLLVRLQVVRWLSGVKIHITSGLRVGDSGTHGLNQAVDISNNRRGDDLDSSWRHKVLKAAYSVGFKRIGIYDKHLHLDINTHRDQDVTWWDESD